jgi:tetratricopeptide (TPR) repeat protein
MVVDVLEQARAASAELRWDDAYEHYREAARHAPLAVDDLSGLADAAWWLGRTDESLTLSEEVYRRYLQGAYTPRAAKLAIDIGFLWMLRGEPTVGSGWISRAKRMLADAPESAAHGYLAYLDVEEALGAGRYGEAIERSRWMADLAERHDDATLCAVALVLLGGAQVRQGRVASGLEVIDEAMLGVRAGQVAPSWAGNLYCHVMDLCFELVDIDRARAWTDATERWCDQHSNAAMFTGICRLHRAQLLHLEGRWAAAEQHADEACRDLADMNVGVVAEGRYRIAEVHRLRGEQVAAEAGYSSAHALGRDPQPGLALLRLAQGKGATALAALRSALAGTGRALDRVPLLAAMVKVAVACDDPDSATCAAEELERIAQTFHTQGLVASAREAAGLTCLARGDAARALPLLREAWQRWGSWTPPTTPRGCGCTSRRRSWRSVTTRRRRGRWKPPRACSPTSVPSTICASSTVCSTACSAVSGRRAGCQHGRWRCCGACAPVTRTGRSLQRSPSVRRRLPGTCPTSSRSSMSRRGPRRRRSPSGTASTGSRGSSSGRQRDRRAGDLDAGVAGRDVDPQL